MSDNLLNPEPCHAITGLYTVPRKKLPLRGRRRSKNGKNTKMVTIKVPAKVAPRKLNASVIEQIIELLLEGLPINKCCDYLGITKDSYYDWKEKGMDYLRQVDQGQKPDNPGHKLHAAFSQAVLKANAEWQLDILRRSMQENSRKSSMWVRDMTQLERRDRSNWGRSETINVADSAPLPDESYL